LALAGGGVRNRPIPWRLGLLEPVAEKK